jgi:peptidoglycan/xylan/chitin deacetylase (PgdA/CDA1 family)
MHLLRRAAAAGSRPVLFAALLAAFALISTSQAQNTDIITPDRDINSVQTGGSSSDGSLTAAVFDTSMLAGFSLSAIPSTSLKRPGSGTCRQARCTAGSCQRCWESCGSCVSPEYKYGCPGATDWALTFDDGPSDATPALLDTLRNLGVRATFCMLGANAASHADTVRRIYAEGHLVCSHSYSHPHLMSLSTESVIAEVVQTARTIAGIIGVRPKYFRPPYGEVDERVRAVLLLTGHVPLLWNMDTQDYNIVRRNQDTSRITQSFSTALAAGISSDNPNSDRGFISLQHDTFLQSVARETDIVGVLRGAGHSVLTVAQCLGDATPYLSADNFAVQIAGNHGADRGLAPMTTASVVIGRSFA